MRFAAMVLGVCHPQKLNWLQSTLRTMDNGADRMPFDAKVLAIDEFRKWRFPGHIMRQCRAQGWNVVKDGHMSRPKSMAHALKVMPKEDLVFYNEDDILVDFPRRAEVEQIFSHHMGDGRMCGMASLTLGGTQMWASGFSGVGDLINAEKNTLFKWDNYFAFAREEDKRDSFFFEFPGLFIRKDLLSMCLKHSVRHCKDMQIEQGLTKAWFDLNLDKKFYKCSIARNNLMEVVQNEHRNIFIKCRLLSNLDPMQGNSMYFGSHKI